MKRTAHYTLLYATAGILLLLQLPAYAQGQETFRLKRVKKEHTPVNVVLMSGYSGLSEPADILQDRFEHTNLTSLGGVAFALQGLVEINTSVLPVWAGVEIGYYRLMKRALYDDPDVRYIGELDIRVDALETLWGIDAKALLSFGPVSRISLLFAGGAQYIDARIDKDLPIEGNLTEDRILPVVMVGASLLLLEYDHGSIDLQFRGLQGFGDYGSTLFQSMIAFTFGF